jgi:hypothetical protein
VPLFSRHPISLAMSAATAQAASRGRFRLGIGPSHQPVVEHVYGLAYDKPVRRVREYVTIVRELLQQGATRYRGELYRVQAAHAVEGGGGVPVLISALADQMCRTAGAVSDGVLPWLAPARYVAERIAPAVRAGAESAGRTPPPIIAQNACALASDPAAVRDAVRREMGFYLAMPAYRALFERAGVPDLSGGPQAGWTDAMIEAVLPWGDETGSPTRSRAISRQGRTRSCCRRSASAPTRRGTTNARSRCSASSRARVRRSDVGGERAAFGQSRDGGEGVRPALAAAAQGDRRADHRRHRLRAALRARAEAARGARQQARGWRSTTRPGPRSHAFSLAITNVHELADPDALIVEYQSDGEVRATSKPYRTATSACSASAAGGSVAWREFHNPEITAIAMTP